jgi:hypothetical protein
MASHFTTPGIPFLKRGPHTRIFERVAMPKREVTLENWAAVRSAHSPSYEELQPGVHLMGNVMGHEDLTGPNFIYTSSVVHVDRANGLVETSNTLYRLGQPHETYKAWQLFEAA